MRIAFFYILISLMFQLSVFADRNLSKEEVRAYWNSNLKIDIKQDFSMFPDSLMVDFIKHLQTSGIDAIGGFYCSGYLKTITISELKNRKWVDCDGTHWTGFVYWKDKGLTYSRKFFKQCDFPIVAISNSRLFDFVIPNMDTLKNEQIINISGVCLKDSGEIIYIKDLRDYGTNFTIYCEINGTCVVKIFDLDDIENDSYLFHNENKSSIQNQLRLKIEMEIEEIK